MERQLIGYQTLSEKHLSLGFIPGEGTIDLLQPANRPFHRDKPEGAEQVWEARLVADQSYVYWDKPSSALEVER